MDTHAAGGPPMSCGNIFIRVLLIFHFGPGKKEDKNGRRQMYPPDNRPCIAFAGHKRLARGPLGSVAKAVNRYLEKRGPAAPSLLIFDAITSEPLEIDLRGSAAKVGARLKARPRVSVEPPGATPATTEAAASRKGRGRPKLGVVGREVTLLPRHWEWLGAQPGGASVTLRKLVERARRESREKDLLRQGQEALYRFIQAMAGDLPGFEEACRTLFGGNSGRFQKEIEAWPKDLKAHIADLSKAAFAAPAAEPNSLAAQSERNVS